MPIPYFNLNNDVVDQARRASRPFSRWIQQITEAVATIAGGGVPAGPITTSGLTMSTNRLLGRTSGGTGAVQEISVDSTLTLSAGVLSATSAVPMHYATTTLTNAEIKALPTTYKTLVSAPGAGKVLMPVWGWYQITAGTPYTNVYTADSQHGIAIAYGDWAIDWSALDVQFTGATARSLLVPMTNVPDAAALLFPQYPTTSFLIAAENTALKLIAWNNTLGDFTGGASGNDGRAGVVYSILNLSDGSLS